MAQRTRGIYAVFSLPSAFDAFQRMVGGTVAKRRFVQEYVRAREGQRVLDIGCGTGAMLEHLPRVDYVGFDLDPDYVAKAQAKLGSRGTFKVGDVGQLQADPNERFDLVLAYGVLHHLDDAEAQALFKLAHAVLNPGGRLVTGDPVISDDQSRLARRIVKMDRGKNVRTQAELTALCDGLFRQTKATILHDLYRIPYSLIILDCEKA